MFPSVKSDGKAFNIAALDTIADPCIELRLALVSRAEKADKQVIFDWILECPNVIGDRLEWKETTNDAWYGYDRRQVKHRMGIKDSLR
ncbi:MAG: hypothetical protein WKF87_06535 [Chryseolinea sp.]